MAWRTRDVEEQRMRFVVAASRKEKSLTELCAEFEISRPTGYGWLQRYQARGIAGMQEESRRPHHSPARTAAGWVKLRDGIGGNGQSLIEPSFPADKSCVFCG